MRFWFGSKPQEEPQKGLKKWVWLQRDFWFWKQVQETEGQVDRVMCMPWPVQRSWNSQTQPLTQELGQDSQTTTQNTANVVSLDVLDLSRVIDICAEHKAMENFDEEMRKLKEWSWLKRNTIWFLSRSIKRMWRDAWIDSEKRRIKKEIEQWLQNWKYTEAKLEEQARASSVWIENKTYLEYEQLDNWKVSLKWNEHLNAAISEWMSLPQGSDARKEKMKTVKQIIDSEYKKITSQKITTDIEQLNVSFARLEKAWLLKDLSTFEARLNIFDIGRMEQWNWERKEWAVVKMIDWLSDKVNKIPGKWFKEKVASFIYHPNFAALASAFWTRSFAWLLVWWVALWPWWGLVAPILVWSATWWVLAWGRAKRELRDRTAQIDRRWAMWLETWNKSVDWESSNEAHKNEHQHSTMDLYNRLAVWLTNPKDEDALIAWIYYLVKHKVGRARNINMLQYDADKSISSQHIEMLSLLNQVHPWLLARFNSRVWETNQQDPLDKIIYDLYKEIDSKAIGAFDVRRKEERDYAWKQWKNFALVSAWVWATVWGILHLAWYGSTPWQDIQWAYHEPVTVMKYPDDLTAYTSIKHPHWYDNWTPAPNFDYTEQYLHTDWKWWWNVSKLLWKNPFYNWHHFWDVVPTDFTSWKIQAVLTINEWWPYIPLPIDWAWNIQIPPSLQDAFGSESFYKIEVWEVHINGWDISINPMQTINWSWELVFNQITTTTAWYYDPATPVPWTDTWYGIPFGWNRYHEIRDSKSKTPVWQFVKIPIDEKETFMYDDLYDDTKQNDYVNLSQDVGDQNISTELAYISLKWDHKLLSNLSSQISDLHQDCKFSINLPAYREWEHIYKTLYEYSVKQLNDDWTRLNPNYYEINVFLNRPNSNIEFDKKTEDEILRFKREHPEIKVNLVKHTFNFEWRPSMGLIYKTMADLSLFRKVKRDNWKERVLIIRNWWADALDKNRFFLSHVIRQFEDDDNVWVYKSESRYPKEVIEKLPLLHFMYTMTSWLNRLYTKWRSNVWSWSYRSDLYAFAWWFDPDLKIWEDIDLAYRIRRITQNQWLKIKRDLRKNAIDNPRRAIMSLYRGDWLHNQYKNYNASENEDLMRMINEMSLEDLWQSQNMIFNKENLESNLSLLYRYYLTKVRLYSKQVNEIKTSWWSENDILDKTYEVTNKLFVRMLSFMWINKSKYKIIKRTTLRSSSSDARIEILDFDYFSNIMRERKFDIYENFEDKIPNKLEEQEKINREFEVALKTLLVWKEIDSRLSEWPWYGNYLRWQEHKAYIISILASISNKSAKRAISAFYAKNWNIWVSSTTNVWYSHTVANAICIWVKSWPNKYADDIKRLYEISGINPVPNDSIRQFNHELWHIITLNFCNDTTINQDGHIAQRLLARNRQLRKESWNWLSLISWREFYEWKWDVVQYAEDLAEVMWLYIMWRKYAEKYLDDRISVARERKQNITPEDKKMYMDFLDEAYNSYVS